MRNHNETCGLLKITNIIYAKVMLLVFYAFNFGTEKNPITFCELKTTHSYKKKPCPAL